MPNNITLADLSEAQTNVLNQVKRFIDNPDKRVFILRGYAGTGKTTLVRFIIPFLTERNIAYRLLATTGRAAKILSNYTNYEAHTIHHMIYAFKGLNKDLSEVEEHTNLDDTGQLYLNFDAVQVVSDIRTVYIIDESSMISDENNEQITQARFGTGKLLTDLLNFDPNPASKFVFVGDPCQLPPVAGSKLSPALEQDYIRNTFHCGVETAELTQIMRQTDGNDIILTASLLRELYSSAPETNIGYNPARPTWGYLPFANRNNIRLHSNLQELINAYIVNFLQKGNERTIFISQSNSKCRAVCNLFRNIKRYNSPLCVGDLLMVIQNQQTTGLMNGDFVEVTAIGDTIQKNFFVPSKRMSVQLSFVDVRVKETFRQREYNTLLIRDCLLQNNLTPIQQSGLFLDFAYRMRKQNITQSKTPLVFNRNLQNDPFLNALRCSYGYAITCHKAQGGEWEDVFIDIPRNITMNPTKASFQWIYTALTRTKEKCYVVNDFYIKSEQEVRNSMQRIYNRLPF